jgi:acetyl-CoA C-acetyltransferase
MNQAYILDAARCAIGSFGGSLSSMKPHELAAPLISRCLEHSGIEPLDVSEVILGCVLQAGHGQNVARQAAVAAGIPFERIAMTVNMVCGSGLISVINAARAIALGEADLIVAGGTECMSLAPYVLSKARYGYRMGNGELVDSMIQDGLWDAFQDYHMGRTAENLASRYGISREQQDSFAAESQAKAQRAIQTGRFRDEIVPLKIAQRKGEPLDFAQDEAPRDGTTRETLGKLKPAFQEGGTVTAGNSSGISDGAAIVLVASDRFVAQKKLRPMARIVSYGCFGSPPEIMGIAPVGAVRHAIRAAAWSIGDLQLIEANEAFAVQALAVGREVAWDPTLVNVNGGAIALGHPIGASGARILVTLLHEMRKRQVTRGLATLCVGGGMGVALCVEMEKS